MCCHRITSGKVEFFLKIRAYALSSGLYGIILFRNFFFKSKEYFYTFLILLKLEHPYGPLEGDILDNSSLEGGKEGVH